MEMQRHSGGKLSPEEAERLEICEATIDSGLKTFWEVGVALAEVRDKRLWYGAYASFTEYLDKKWHLRRSYAGSLMLAADIRMELAERVAERREKLRAARPAEAPEPEADDDLPPFDLPDSVESACALRKLDTEDKIRVLEELKSRELPASKSNIKQVVDQILPPSPKIPKLSYGTIRNSIDAIGPAGGVFRFAGPGPDRRIFPVPGTPRTGGRRAEENGRHSRKPACRAGR